MIRQHTAALAAGYPFVHTTSDIEEMEASGELVRLFGNADYGFRAGVRSMVGRPEMKIFIERLARDYRAACSEPLVVTSMTRAMDRQPRNSHPLSVHPAGIAVDLRVSQNAPCRVWLEDTLLDMEEEGLLDGIRERRPPHYHVALFAERYMAYIDPVLQAEQSAERARLAAERLTVLAARPTVTEGTAGDWPLGRFFVFVSAMFLGVFLVGRRSRDTVRS